MPDPTRPQGLEFVPTVKQILFRLRMLERKSRRASTVQRLVYTYPSLVAFTSTVTSQSVPITWVVPFADTNYTVVRDVALPAGSTAVTSTRVSSKTVNGCTVTVDAGGVAIPAGAVLTADGIHL